MGVGFFHRFDVTSLTSLTSLDVAIMPMYRVFEVGEVHLENLTLTSLDPHYFHHGSNKT